MLSTIHAFTRLTTYRTICKYNTPSTIAAVFRAPFDPTSANVLTFSATMPRYDPEDPLNWPRKRKMWSLFMAFVYTMGVGIATTLHYSVIADIERDAGIPTVDLGEILKSNFERWGWFCLLLVYAVNGNGVMFLFGKLDLNLFDQDKCTDEKQYVYVYSYQKIAMVRVLSGDMLTSE